jgi:hypothetical protein
MLDRRQRIASARLTGTTEAHTQMRRLDREQALAGIAEVLAEFAPDVRAAILADAAAVYIDGDRHHDQASAELLATAGADLERARQIRTEREDKPNPLTSIAGQANRPREPEVEQQGARDRARRTLAEMDAHWTPEKWAEFDQREDTP